MSTGQSAVYPPEGLPEFAFLGRSNVGKSSLLNKLVDQKGLAKTSSTPGRTQLINFFQVEDKYCFVDLPGYGYAKVDKETHRSWQSLIEPGHPPEFGFVPALTRCAAGLDGSRSRLAGLVG